MNPMLQLRLITGGCVGWRMAYIYPVTVYTVNSVSDRNSSGAKGQLRMPHGVDSNFEQSSRITIT